MAPKGAIDHKTTTKNGGNQNNLGSSDQRRLSHNIFLTFLNLIVYDFFKKLGSSTQDSSPQISLVSSGGVNIIF